MSSRLKTLAGNFAGNPLVVILVSSLNRPARFYNEMITNQDILDLESDLVQSDLV